MHFSNLSDRADRIANLSIGNEYETCGSDITSLLTADQTEQIAQAKGIIYGAFKLAIQAGFAKDLAGVPADEQSGTRILRDARAN
jgi:hypothetical protein